MAGNVVQLSFKGLHLGTMNCVGAPVRVPRHVTVERGFRPEYAHQFTMVPVTTSLSYPLFLEGVRRKTAISDVGYIRLCIKANPDGGMSLLVYYQISDPYFWDNTYNNADLEHLLLLGKTYSGAELLGAFAHIVDNSRDASATRVNISVASFMKLKMEQIFQSYHFWMMGLEAALSLGLNILVISQTSGSRSISFLSQSLNRDNKEFIEIPLLGFWRSEQAMVLDESLHPKTSSEKSLNLLKDHTPFDEFSLGGLFEKFGNGSGTRILIWNFAKDGVTGEDALRWIESDIVICSNSSSRPDCSLTSFLKFLYRESTMNISIQGLRVLNFSWENSLTRKETMDDLVMGNQIQVTFGFSETDCVENNCGVLIYWNGRLIEAHKKVGNMQSGCSRGVIGAVEVSHFMPKQNIHVLQSKQQFRHCYAYDQLEESLERSYNNYAARNLTPEEMNNTPTRSDDPLFEWVHCDKCGKWRRLHPSVDKNYLPKNWFCTDFPYLGSCKEKEEKEVDGKYMIQIDDPMPR